MTKNEEGTMYTIKVIFLIALAILVAYLLMSGKNLKAPQNPLDSGTSDLNQSQDQLEMVNVDAVDTGLGQLNSQVSSY